MNGELLHLRNTVPLPAASCPLVSDQRSNVPDARAQSNRLHHRQTVRVADTRLRGHGVALLTAPGGRLGVAGGVSVSPTGALCPVPNGVALKGELSTYSTSCWFTAASDGFGED